MATWMAVGVEQNPLKLALTAVSTQKLMLAGLFEGIFRLLLLMDSVRTPPRSLQARLDEALPTFAKSISPVLLPHEVLTEQPTRAWMLKLVVL